MFPPPLDSLWIFSFIFDFLLENDLLTYSFLFLFLFCYCFGIYSGWCPLSFLICGLVSDINLEKFSVIILSMSSVPYSLFWYSHSAYVILFFRCLMVLGYSVMFFQSLFSFGFSRILFIYLLPQRLFSQLCPVY